MAGDTPGSTKGARPNRGQLAWSVLLNAILLGFWIFVQRWILGMAPSDEPEMVA